MNEPKFLYGPVSKGVYLALISTAVLVAIINFRWLPTYIVFLLFLGLGLRPFLEVTGIYGLYVAITAGASERVDRKWVAKRRREVDAAEALKRIKKSRAKDPRLPDNW